MKKIICILLVIFILTANIVAILPTESKATTTPSISDFEDEIKLQQSVLYALQLLDDEMTDYEKATVLGQYIQEGNQYASGDRDQSEYGVLVDHKAVCGGYANTYKMLLNDAGIPCEYISSTLANHAWNVCLIDGKWTYVDRTKGVSTSGVATECSSVHFKAKSEMTGGLYQKGDARVIDNNIFAGNLVDGETIPNETIYESRVYYDDDYKYYIEYRNILNPTWFPLYRENRKTGEKTKLAEVLPNYHNAETGLVKNGSKLYYVGTDKKTVWSINTDGTGTQVAYRSDIDGEEIGGVFVQDGYMYYITYYPNQSSNVISTERHNKGFQLDYEMDSGIYTVNNSQSKYQFIYAKSGNAVSIVACIGIDGNEPSGELYIPDTIDGKPVIGIADRVFESKDKLTGDLDLPKDLQYIGNYAFNQCKNINSITFHEKIKCIGYSAFKDFDSITSLTLPDSLTYIDASAFSWSHNIKNVTIGKNLKFLSAHLFSYCSALESITIPENIERIGYEAIYQTSALEYILIEAKNIQSMEFEDIDTDIYLYGGTQTSQYADENHIEYIDLRYLKPTLIIHPTTIDMDIDDEPVTITYEIQPKFYPNKTVAFKSENTSVAKVDSTGKVTAVGEGSTTISVSLDGVTEICTIKVSKRENFEKITKQFNEPNTSTQIKARTNKGTEIVVDWQSNQPEIVETQPNGYVIPKSGGFATLTATDPAYGTANLWIYVSLPIRLSNGSSRYAGDLNGDGRINIFDALSIEDIITYQTFTEDNLKIADINGDNRIDETDVNLIREIYNTSVFRIHQYEIPIESITLNQTNISIEKNTDFQLIATINPENTTQDQTITWSSSADKIASVNDGVITGISQGEAIITAETSNGKKATCVVTVTETVTSPYVLGDVDEDGSITTADASMVLKYYVGIIKENEFSNNQKLAADVNFDENITTADASQILKYYVGMIHDF